MFNISQNTEKYFNRTIIYVQTSMWPTYTDLTMKLALFLLFIGSHVISRHLYS